MKSTKNLILYKNFENGKLFYNMAWIMENYENEYYNREDIEALLYECFNQLSELAVSHGFKGNLWHNFIAFILVNNENAYSRGCEIRGGMEGSVNQIALHDFKIMKDLFDFDFTELAKDYEIDCMMHCFIMRVQATAESFLIKESVTVSVPCLKYTVILTVPALVALEVM